MTSRMTQSEFCASAMYPGACFCMSAYARSRDLRVYSLRAAVAAPGGPPGAGVFCEVKGVRGTLAEEEGDVFAAAAVV